MMKAKWTFFHWGWCNEVMNMDSTIKELCNIPAIYYSYAYLVSTHTALQLSDHIINFSTTSNYLKINCGVPLVVILEITVLQCWIWTILHSWLYTSGGVFMQILIPLHQILHHFRNIFQLIHNTPSQDLHIDHNI